jgi:UDP-GlcNAc:undecaprenyl-phosphate/decaprenyl-phosphate GlcNAc-1-phosphate transferase
MATLALKLRFESNVANFSGWLCPVLILGATIFDTTLVTISRSRRGLLPFSTPGKDHSAHRLANLGLGQRGAVLTLYMIGAVCGGAGVLATYLSNTASAILGAAVLVVMLVAVAALERAPYERQKSKKEAAASAASPS